MYFIKTLPVTGLFCRLKDHSFSSPLWVKFPGQLLSFQLSLQTDTFMSIIKFLTLRRNNKCRLLTPPRNKLTGSCDTTIYINSDGTSVCGIYLERGLTWTKARNKCIAKGGKLPEIKSAENYGTIFIWKVFYARAKTECT